MGSKGLGLMVTLQLYKQNLDSFLDRNSSEQPLHIKRHHDLVVVKFLTKDTVLLETMGPFAGGKTLSLPNVVAMNSPWWDENRNRGKDEATEQPMTIILFRRLTEVSFNVFVMLQAIIAVQQKLFHSCSCFLHHTVK